MAFSKWWKRVWQFDRNKFKPKSTFDTRKKDAAIEIYLNSLEEKLMNIEIPENKYNNLAREERSALFNLKNKKAIVIKCAKRASRLLSGIRIIILKRLRSNWKIKIFMRRCVMIPDPLSAPYMKQLKKFVKEAIWMQMQVSISWWKTQSLLAFTYSQKYINDCMMFLVVLLFQTTVFIPKKCLLF